jgi:hypothetical protein
MPKYVKTDGTNLLGFKSFDNANTHLSRADAEALGKPFWLPYITAPRPVYTSETQHAPVQGDDIIYPGKVEQHWNPAVAKTQAEIDAESQETQDNAMGRLDQASGIDKVLGAALFEVVNDVRVLKGDTPITLEQFKTWLRSKF